MSLKWIGLSMMLGGAASGVGAYKMMDGKSSFEDGTFLIKILLAGAGAISFIIGIVLILISWFISIP